MQKKILRRGTLQLACGQAKPGAALSSWGINMPNFCREFNAKTSSQETGKVISVAIEVYDDKSFSFQTKSVPTALLLKEAMQKGTDKTISNAALDDIIKAKMNDLNTDSYDSIRKIILGSAKSAGIEVKD